ncbi:DUF305 domain-containing protein [Citricoccus nitrophenolicus]|jgi:uncharacterized protein (DUF305 family)|uniref:DUF305 domain-containing protein n=1 Tax=Citricoccus nitrophenolicus TaxID=863575 RepID=A0ABV0ILT8_9MICC
MSAFSLTDRPTGSRLSRVLLVLAAAVVLVAGGWSVGRLSAPGSSVPAEGSPEAGFARDMQTHHLQAVEMTILVRDRTKDPEIRQLAYDVARTQQQQAGQMYGWLSMWGLPQASPQPAMAWMNERTAHGSAPDAGHTGSAEDPGMPGMATAAELAELSAAEGEEAERLYLQLMIPHHQAGTTMAEAALEQTDTPAVRSLAQSILTSQQSEIRYMEELLEAR